MNHIAISILNYNSSEATIACVESLRLAALNDAPSTKISIYVADNQSEKSQQQLLNSLIEYPQVTVLQHSNNIGFSAGHNANLAVIFRTEQPDFVWVLNNDCLIDIATINALVLCAKEHPQVAMWGSSILTADGKAVQCAGGCFYNTWLSTFKQYGNNQKSSDLTNMNNLAFDYLSGASLFFTVEGIKSGFVAWQSKRSSKSFTQLFNEDYFLYFEELDLAKRLKPEYEMAWCKSAIIRHIGGASTGTSLGRASEMAEYHSTLSALKFTRKHYPRKLWVMAPARYLLKCIQLVLKGRISLVKQINRAYRDFWFSKPTDNS